MSAKDRYSEWSCVKATWQYTLGFKCEKLVLCTVLTTLSICFALKGKVEKAPVLAWELTYNRCSELSQNVCIHSIGMKNCFKYQNIELFRNFMLLNWPKFISKRYHQTLTYYVSHNCHFTETWEECLFSPSIHTFKTNTTKEFWVHSLGQLLLF